MDEIPHIKASCFVDDRVIATTGPDCVRTLGQALDSNQEYEKRYEMKGNQKKRGHAASHEADRRILRKTRPMTPTTTSITAVGAVINIGARRAVTGSTASAIS